MNGKDVKRSKIKKKLEIDDLISNIGFSTTLFIINSKSNENYKLHTFKNQLIYLSNDDYVNNKIKNNKNNKNILNQKINSKKILPSKIQKVSKTFKKPKPLYSKQEFFSILNTLQSKSKDNTKHAFVN